MKDHGSRMCFEMKFYYTRHYWTENEGRSILWKKNAIHVEWAFVISKVYASEKSSKRLRRTDRYNSALHPSGVAKSTPSVAPPAPNTQPGLWAPGASVRVLGPKPWPSQLFSRGCAPEKSGKPISGAWSEQNQKIRVVSCRTSERRRNFKCAGYLLPSARNGCASTIY